MILLAPAMVMHADSAARQDVLAWRERQDRKMRGEHSPFAADHVEILGRERNTIGSAADAAVRLPDAGIPAIAGEVVLRNGEAVLVAASPELKVNGKFEKERVLAAEDWISLGQYRLQLRRPDGKAALRVSNLKGQAMLGYRGLKYFDIDERYRVPARFTESLGQQEVTVDSSKGGPQRLPYAGKLSFELLGKPYTLDAFIDGDEPEALFVIFRDATSGRESYGVGRYIYVECTATGQTILDFNKAFNPLCAYGPLFFCPIPPKQNDLPVRIPVGE
ncbi:MAG TPA: DUF1684 domain-containing protein, partial [Holophagaceae bacterium]|nr:DUF1684 domain-containing protein [Holophagaceae bacterium]